MTSRPARLRKKGRGKLIRETTLLPRDLICPLFVDESAKKPVAIPSLPGFYHHTVETAVSEVEAIMELGIPAVIIFGVPREKDETGSSALSGIVQDTIRAIKTDVSDAIVIADVCLCDYTTDGWCGIHDSQEILDAPTLEMLQRIAASYARAGVDIVAPSAMIDGMVGAIRSKLDHEGFDDLAIMSYAVKYYSNFYEPWRHAAETGPYGNPQDETLKRGFFTSIVDHFKGRFADQFVRGATFEQKILGMHHMDPANTDEAVREVRLDLEEGADIIMIKPALTCLDIIYRIKQTFGVPVAAFHVSGEYAMLRAAIDNGTIPSDAILETLLSIKRAGADMIVTYFAKEAAKRLASE